MSLSDFGSIASIISLIIGIITGFVACKKIYLKKEVKSNSTKSIFQFGNNNQEIK
jgi:hypothetical protein